MISKKHPAKRIKRTVPALLCILAFSAAVLPEAARAALPHLSISNNTAAIDDDFDRLFREGKDLIYKQQWAQATAKFKELINKYPNDKSAAAVLYWLAFSYKKQKAFKQAEEILDRLLKDFPTSSWAADAAVMKIQVAPATTRNVTAGNPEPDGSKLAITYAASKIPLDREDEIRLAAFQSLISVDMKRAIETMGGMLTAKSRASETLKREVMRAFVTARLLNPRQLTDFMRLLRETLFKGLQNEPNINIRKEIIYTLAGIYDEWAIKYLSGIYTSENNKEIKKTIIDSFNDPARDIPNSSVAKFGSRVASIRKLEAEKLIEIVRTDKDAELRRLAFYKLQRIGLGKPKPGQEEQTIINELIRLYDAETDEELKILFIRSLRDTQQTQAVKKLMDIAKNDKSDKLRLEAIRSLKTSREPEVVKFLEELIK